MGHNDRKSEGNPDELVLKPRKSTQLKKKRKRAHLSVSDAAAESEVQTNVLLLKEAQRLRDTSRRTGLPQANKSQGPKLESNDDGDTGANDVAGGLGKAFATERSARAEEERMARNVDEKMRERFGETQPEAPVLDAAKQYEDALYAVPEHLRQESRPMYDPSEGLPAAGVEEIELPGTVRKHNEIATHEAKNKLMAHRVTSAHGERHEPEVVGNMSVNFLQHRKERDQNYADSTNTLAGSEPETVRRAQSRENSREMATDVQAVERWRKRWRR